MLRVGLPVKTVVALCPDILPLAASKTLAGIPLASSANNNTLSECTPASASGCSCLDVRHDINVLCGWLLSSIRSLLISSKSLKGFFRRLATFFISAKQASKSWADVGAVTTVFDGTRIKTCHMAAIATAVDFPTPCPERQVTRLVFGSATARNSSFCQSSGSMPITSIANFTGSFR